MTHGKVQDNRRCGYTEGQGKRQKYVQGTQAQIPLKTNDTH